MARLSLVLLGTFQASLGEKPISEFEAEKVWALLAYLTVEADLPHRRDVLTGLLGPAWPDTLLASV